MPGFQVHQLAVHGIRPVSFTLDSGEHVALTGPSGVGKTRLLRAMADLEPHAGEVALGGRSSNTVAAPAWRRRVALVPTESAWWFRTAAEHFPRWPPPDLKALALPARIGDRPVEQLSSGERQRLALLRALAGDPDVLLLDEPTANLDDDNAARLDRVVAALRRERGVCVVRVGHGGMPSESRRIEVEPA